MASDLTNSGVPDKASQLLAGWYTEAQKRMRAMILQPTGKTEKAQEFRQARAAELSAQVDRILAELGQASAKWTGENVGNAYKAGIERAEQQAKEAGLRDSDALKGSTALIDKRAVRVFALDTVADLSKAADSMGQTAKSLLRQTAQIGLAEADINTILAGGVIEGTPVETIRQLREELIRVNEGRLVKIIDKNGDEMHLDAGKYAEMVVRTKTRQANVYARHERLGELGLDLVRIIGRLSDNFCTAFVGQVFSLSGKSAKYPAYSSLPSGGPPFHPNCSKSTTPFIEELATEKQLDAAKGVEDAQKLLGMDPSKAQRAYKDLQLRPQATENLKKITPVNERVTTVDGSETPGASKPAKAAKPLGNPDADLVTVAEKFNPDTGWTVMGSTPTPSEAKPGKARPTTAELQAKLDAKRAENQRLREQLDAIRRETERMQAELQALIAAGASNSEIEAIKRKIAEAEARVRAYERETRKAEKNG